MKKYLEYVVVFILGFIVCAAVLKSFYGTPSSNGPVEAPSIQRGGVGIAKVGSNQVRDAAKLVSGYVVNIDTVGRPVRRSPDSFFGFPFGGSEEVVPKGQASGVVFSSDGYILTNNHVAANATKLTVTLPDGNQYNAKLIGRDPKTDLAVIKIDAKNLKYAEFAKASDQPQPGDWVIAVGSPLGFQSTVTVGVVSATKRGPINIDGEVLQEVIQTDAAINPGNSGGALADLNGTVVGINTAIASTSGGSIGIGFAIPSNVAKNVAEQLVKHGKVTRPWLGIVYRPYNESRRKELSQAGATGLPKQDGAEVVEVYQGGPAAQGGLQPNDIILKVNGKPVSASAQHEDGKVNISDEIAKVKVGTRVTMEVWHAANGRIGTVGIRVGAMPTDLGNQP